MYLQLGEGANLRHAPTGQTPSPTAETPKKQLKQPLTLETIPQPIFIPAPLESAERPRSAERHVDGL